MIIYINHSFPASQTIPSHPSSMVFGFSASSGLSVTEAPTGSLLACWTTIHMPLLMDLGESHHATVLQQPIRLRQIFVCNGRLSCILQCFTASIASGNTSDMWLSTCDIVATGDSPATVATPVTYYDLATQATPEVSQRSARICGSPLATPNILLRSPYMQRVTSDDS